MNNEVFNHNASVQRQSKHELPRGSKARSIDKLSNPPKEVRQGCHKSETHPVSLNQNFC